MHLYLCLKGVVCLFDLLLLFVNLLCYIFFINLSDKLSFLFITDLTFYIHRLYKNLSILFTKYHVITNFITKTI